MTDPTEHDVLAWSRSAWDRGYEDGYKKRPKQPRYVEDVPPAVRDAYASGYSSGGATRAAADQFRKTHGPRPRI